MNSSIALSAFGGLSAIAMLAFTDGLPLKNRVLWILFTFFFPVMAIPVYFTRERRTFLKFSGLLLASFFGWILVTGTLANMLPADPESKQNENKPVPAPSISKKSKPTQAEILAAKKQEAAQKRELAESKKKIDAYLAKVKIQGRKEYAENVENDMLSKGYDVHVNTKGSENTTLVFKYVLISRPWVYNFTHNEEFNTKMRDMGFKKVVFTNGYNNTWNVSY